jgi:hypothetical protein
MRRIALNFLNPGTSGIFYLISNIEQGISNFEGKVKSQKVLLHSKFSLEIRYSLFDIRYSLYEELFQHR